MNWYKRAKFKSTSWIQEDIPSGISPFDLIEEDIPEKSWSNPTSDSSIKSRAEELLVEKGWNNVHDFASSCRIAPSLVYNLLNGKRPAVNWDTGEWSSTATKIAEMLDVSPEYLFPIAKDEYQQYQAGKAYRGKIPKDKVLDLYETAWKLTGLKPRSNSGIDFSQLKEGIEKVLQTLTSRERIVTEECTMGGRSLTDVAKELGLSISRVRQIGLKALRKFRHPSRIKLLEGLLEDYIK